MLEKLPRVRDNNAALQVRLRLDGRDHFINRLGPFCYRVVQARKQAFRSEIWRDDQQGVLELFYFNELRASVAKRSHPMHLREFSKSCHRGVSVANKYTHLWVQRFRFGVPARGKYAHFW